MAIYDVAGNVLDTAGVSRFPVEGHTSLDIQIAINAAYNAGGGVVELEAETTYSVTDQIVLYSDFVSLVGNGAKLDASSNSGASAIKIIGGNKLETESEQIRQQYLHFMEGVYLIGPNRTADYTGGRTGTGIICAGTSLTSISQGFLIKNCAIGGFHIGVDFQAQAWCNTLFNCDISVCDIGVRCASGYQNYGEKLTIISGCIHACSLALSINHNNATFQCIGTAFDYNFAIADCTIGHIYFANCHLESTKNKDYWLKVTGGVVLVRDSVFYGSQGSYGLVSMTGGKLYLKDNTKETWSMAANSISGGTFDESWI
jgi:hypothetical protein